jgi:UDP:flavonoid glycosyltransferase YjiC (YdhE family)
VIVPHIADQGFFANEIKRLGCGIRLNKRRWPEKLARAVLQVESSGALIRNAARAHRTLMGECGPEAAVRSIEEYVAVPKQNGRAARSRFVAGQSPAHVGESGA